MEKASNCLGSVYDQEVTYLWLACSLFRQLLYLVMKSFTYKELVEGTSSHPTTLMAYDLFWESIRIQSFIVYLKSFPLIIIFKPFLYLL